jgi:hypothetical protein
MPTKKSDPIPILHVRKGATLKEIYAARRKSFTAEELQRYTRDEEMVPAEQVLAAMEAVHKRELARMQKKATSKRKAKR